MTFFFSLIGTTAARFPDVPVVRPGSKKLAVTFYESLTFKLRKAIAALVGLTLPHANNGSSAGALESVNCLGVAIKMPF